jgi:hypothetical protein
VVWFLLPPSEESLYAKAEALLASEKWIDWNEARDGKLRVLLERFPDGKYAEWAEERISWVNAREAERRMERDSQRGRKDNWSPAQHQYAEARNYERFGDLATALDKFRAIQNLFADQEEAKPIIFLAGEAIQRIKQSGEATSLQALLTKKLDLADQAYDKAQIAAAKVIWEAIVELYDKNQQVAPLVQQAKTRLQDLSSRK